ncbi:MAG: aminotransferase class I/II-fold pyridoxal phosphate-dependent enzyme [Oscillospiraceae bacterium]
MIDYNSILAKAAVDMKPSGIRKFFDIAETLEGVISLGVGEPDFPTPWKIRQKAIATLEKGRIPYTANRGLAELRRAICTYIQATVGTTYDPDSEVIVTVGGSEAIDLSIRATVEAGDEVLVVEPSFVCYAPIVALCGGVAVPIRTRVEDKFKLTAQALAEKITPKTKLLILPYPNNPTGAVMHKDELEAIAEVLRGTNILVLSDEIYSELTFGAAHVSISALDGMRERTILINGFSKAFAMTGWRLGYMAGPQEVIEHMLKIHQYGIMSSPTVSQHAAIEALRSCQEDVAAMVSEYNIRRRYMVDALNKLGLPCFEPEGAFYVFPSIQSTGLSSTDFCERLVYSKKVAVVPGNAFGDCGEGFIRISYAYSIKHLKEAMRRIGEFLDELKNENSQ